MSTLVEVDDCLNNVRSHAEALALLFLRLDGCARDDFDNLASEIRGELRWLGEQIAEAKILLNEVRGAE